ncbi:MAG: galactose ABC transporter substrate-binding protein [Clostridium sp.]|nr:galactose ABC transporter substrate-binding protein [Clostridium sp.]
MKKINLSVLIVAAAVAAVGGLWFYGTKDGGREEKKTALRIGVLLYRNDDTFIGTLRNSLEQAAKDYEKETGIRVALDVRDAKRNQITQNSQAERMIDLDCDVLCVNIVDRSAASGIIDKAMEADTPIVFFNREPVAEDMNRWEKLYYVGADAKESAVLEGQILVDAYKKNPSSLDRNGDGVVSYVLLEGETNHQDSLIRTEWSIQTLKDGGVPIRRITGGIANWEKNQASALMEQWISEYGTEIELVIANNDDMALGAIDAIERAGIVTGTIKLVGIDGTPAGQDAFREGKLFGTVESSKEIYAKRIFDTAEELAMGKEVTQEKYFWSPQQMIAN